MIAIAAQLFAGLLLSSMPMVFAQKTPLCLSKILSSDNPHCRTSVRHIEGGGIGYNHGYTTFEGFFSPDPKQLNWMPFLDMRGHVFNNGKFAANVGLGLRKIVGCRVYGLNVYYDYRNSKKIHYNQLGFGVETLGELWDLRINAYLPVGKTITSPSDAKFTQFSGHEMLVSQKYRLANKGVNAELGFHLGKSRCFDFYAAAGPYYYTGKIGSQFWGGKGRLVGKYKDYIKLQLSNSYDKVFRNRFQCELTLTLPFGGGSSEQHADDYNAWARSEMLFSRIVQPVERQEIIVETCSTTCCPVLDPVTRQPYNFVFVDNTSHSLGTYESPYPTLALAQAHSAPNDVIYVFPGDGTTQGMDEGITLQLNQKFWGSGVNHSIEASQGTIVIPAQTTTAPKITNIAGDGITLSSVNQVSGIHIVDAADHGIIAKNARDIDISDCVIDASQSDQIHLEYNGISGSAVLSRLTLTNGGVDAIFIDAPATLMGCTVSDCIIKNNAVYTINASFAKQASFNVTNNIFENNVNGTNFNFSGPSTLLVSGNRFNGTTSVSSAPLIISMGSSSLDATITNNDMSDNIKGAMHFVLNNPDLAKLTVRNNTISNNGTGAAGPFGAPIFIDPNGTNLGNCQLNLIDNVFSENTGSSLYCANGNFDDFQVNAIGNTITNNGGGGLVFANGTNTFSLSATRNTISGGTDHGITTVGNITIANAHMNISNNRITANINSASGIALSHVGTDLNLIVTDNDISGNDSSGVLVFASPGVIENIAVKIENNTINNNQNLGSNASGGIDLEQYTNLSGSIVNNTLLNNVPTGLYVGSTEASPSVCLNMSGNNSDTGYVLSSGTGIFNLAPCDVETVNTGAFTQIGAITIVQSCPDAVPCT